MRTINKVTAFVALTSSEICPEDYKTLIKVIRRGIDAELEIGSCFDCYEASDDEIEILEKYVYAS